MYDLEFQESHGGDLQIYTSCHITCFGFTYMEGSVFTKQKVKEQRQGDRALGPVPRLTQACARCPSGPARRHRCSCSRSSCHSPGSQWEGLGQSPGSWTALAMPPACPSTHLQEHVPRLYASISCHSTALHDGTNVDAAIAPLIALAHNGDSQEVVLLCGGS